MNDLNICESTVEGWKTAGTFLYILKVTVSLVIVITSIMLFFKVIEKGNNVELSKAIKGTFFKIIAGILVFVLPITIPKIMDMLAPEYNDADMYACSICLESPGSSDCEYYVNKYLDARKNDEAQFEDIEVNGDLNTCELSLGNAGASDFSYKGNGSVPSKFTSQTRRIVERHIYDFTYSNYHSYVNSKGGLKKYIKSLGGVFARNYGKTLKGESVDDLVEASEYVFGIMQMYGFDYFNGQSDDGGHYCKWGGSCMQYSDLHQAQAENRVDEFNFPSGSGDAFYPGSMRYEDYGLSGPKDNFDKLIEGDNMTTNCNWSVDMVYFKAGIFGKGEGKGITAANFKKMAKKGKVVTRLCDVKVGDVIHFFRNSVDPKNPSTWSGWGHVAYIGEVNGKKHKVTVYDGGSRFMMGRNFKWTFKIDPEKDEWPKTLGGFKGYGIVRVKELKQ